jgi:hypothetical protein
LLNSPRNKRCAEIASGKAREMLQSLFASKRDHKCIDVALDNFPTIAIFMAQVPEDGFKKRKNQRKSILDVKDISSLHCLAAVNYLADGTHTQVLFLGTTRDNPPVDSIHTMWRGNGLATYLLCMLVKQHTVNDWDWKYCALYLQASHQRDNPARRFYLKMGFQCHDHNDNGYEKLPYQFRLQVHNHPRIWIDEKKRGHVPVCVA